MSAPGGAFARGFAGLGGPGAAAAIVAGGILVGALGGGLAASQGSGRPAGATGRLAVHACPESGAPLLMIQAGQRLLVTGRTEDGTWLRIHFPEPGRTEAWVQASPLTVDGSIAGLPVATCMPELAVAPPSIEPGMSLTAVADNPPSAPPTPEPTPTPSPTAVANARPGLSGLTVSTGKISYDTGDYCPDAVKRVTFKVKATDSIGVASVALYWREPGAGSYVKTAMTRTTGSTTSGTWQTTLDTTANGITEAGKLAYYAIATDGQGATRRLPTEGASTITVAVCVNAGPTITGVAPSSGTSIFWDPLFVGNCQTARDFTATVKDPQGVKSVTLFYRRPGDTWKSKPMDNTILKGKWYANIDTLGDGRGWNWIPDPPTDPMSWYIRAVDDEGKATKLATRTLTVKRCDTEATFSGLGPVDQSYSCTTTSIPIVASVTDRDQPSSKALKVTIDWRIFDARSEALLTSGRSATSLSRPGYLGSTGTFNGKAYQYIYLDLRATSTDQYGGTTGSGDWSRTRMSCVTP